MFRALAGIGTTAACTLALAIWWQSAFRLGASYLAGTFAVCIGGASAILRGIAHDHPYATLGTANHITLARGGLIALLAGIITVHPPPALVGLATAVASLALLLDAIDGWAARRYRTSSAFGARFDMESDALLILILSVLAWQFGKAGAWVLLSGGLRYLFVLAGWLVPALRRPLPASRRRKLIAALQGIALVSAIAPFVARAASAPIAAAGLLLLAASFLIDLLWLEQQRHRPLPAVPSME